ncbi:hypothetical protein BC827DRAFT_1140825 [Russula dissimulans]|nr:hypothetical protein BC827DRAFT_1140825 [Russula dissimulans]
MVWSSAQPHSVEDMVLHAFGKDRTWLVAIWARDTLGLEEGHYHSNVQTIKDLEKPWAFLAPRSLTSPVSPPEPKSEPPQTWTGHSAATTLLLDDSFVKTARQPYNHLPVPEYTRAQRNADLRKRKKERQLVVVDEADDSARASASAPAPVHGVPDETLLAVIGILHAARMQSSIAGWLCAGALQSERGAAWYEDPVSVRAWARRGREAMQELQLPVEHGVEP